MSEALRSFYKFLAISILAVAVVSFLLAHVIGLKTARGLHGGRSEGKPFNEEAFRNNLAVRFNSAAAPQPGQRPLAPEDLVIEKVEPLKAGDTGLYAVLVSIPALGPAYSQVRIVDASGRYIYDGEVVDLASGRSASAVAVDKISRVNVPADAGQVVYRGTGRHVVVFVGHPSSEQAQAVWKFLMDRQAAMAELRILHLPYEAGSDVASTVLAYAQMHNLQPLETAQFAFSSIPPLTGTGEAAVADYRRDVMKRFLEKFPDLKVRLGADPDKAIETVFNATKDMVATDINQAMALRAGPPPYGESPPPGVFIDGLYLKGPSLQRMGELLR